MLKISVLITTTLSQNTMAIRYLELKGEEKHFAAAGRYDCSPHHVSSPLAAPKPTRMVSCGFGPSNLNSKSFKYYWKKGSWARTQPALSVSVLKVVTAPMV